MQPQFSSRSRLSRVLLSPRRGLLLSLLMLASRRSAVQPVDDGVASATYLKIAPEYLGQNAASQASVTLFSAATRRPGLPGCRPFAPGWVQP